MATKRVKMANDRKVITIQFTIQEAGHILDAITVAWRTRPEDCEAPLQWAHDRLSKKYSEAINRDEGE